MIGWIKRKLAERAERKADEIVYIESIKGAIALDVMLRDREWFGGAKADFNEITGKPFIEVLIVSEFPGTLSTFIPPRIGVVPVLVRFGTKL